MTLTVRARMQYKCVPPLKAAYRSSFRYVVKQSHFIKGAVVSPPKLVIFHLWPMREKESDAVIHLRGKLQ